jgi:hypothetical protein
MTYTNLDTLVRRSLLESGLPLHWYAEGLFLAASCIRELSFDSLQVINTKKLPVGDYYEVNLPDDFVDDLALTIPVGGLLQPIAKNNAISPLRYTDSTGAFVPYNTATPDDTTTLFGLNTNWFWFWNINDYGEPTGRYFGAGGGAHQNGYKVVRERNQIQLTESFTSGEVVLQYISDGQSADSATQVDVMAFSCIQAYIAWKRSDNADLKDSGEARTYYNERRLFRARKNDVTITDLKNIIRKNFHASIKN